MSGVRRLTGGKAVREAAGLMQIALWPVIKQQGDSTSDRQTVTSDGGCRSLAWPVITLLLRTFVIGLRHF